MSLLIESDSTSLSRWWWWGLCLFLNFFVLLIFAQEGAMVLF